MFFYKESILNVIQMWIETQILSGSLATGTGDNFGWSVSINSSGNRAVVGAYRDEGIGYGNSSGVAYIFVSGANGWSQQQALSGSLAIGSSDNFAYSVAMNSAGDRIIVGAVADEAIGSGDSSGLAYIFVSGANGWSEQQILSGSLATGSVDGFGWSVSMNSAGDRVVIGSKDDEAISNGVNSGLAYIFVSGANGWSQQHIFSGSLATAINDGFGYSVAMNSAGDRIAVGAKDDEATGLANGSGVVYMFASGANGWMQQQILSGSLATGSADGFGWSVGINSAGDRIIVGAKEDEDINSSSSSGLAYIFISGANGWIQQQILSGSLATAGSDGFGWSVAMNSAGDRVIVGASSDESAAGGDSSGLAYIFISGANGWSEQQIISGSLATQTNNNFGYSVAMNSVGERIIVGAYQDEAVITISSSGLAYINDFKTI